MLNKFSIRIRLVFLTVLVLVLCCIGLTFITNYAANRMAVQLAAVVTPAQSITTNLTEVNQTEIMSAVGFDENNMEWQNEIVNKFYQTSFMYMLFIIVIGGWITYILSGKILKPLTKLNDTIKSRTVTTLSNEIVVPDTNDEIADITVSFNKMSARIHEAFLFQQQFSANVAHELKTPLTILKAKIDVFYKHQNHSQKEYDQLIEILHQQIIRLSDLTQTLLSITNHEELNEKENFLLSDLLESVVSELDDFAKQKKITFESHVANFEIYGNIDALYQAFYNLLHNSIKYGYEGGIVVICAFYYQDYLDVKIYDSGIGIPKEVANRVFEPFFRVDSSRCRKIGGAGLGLSIVRNIIEKHHGRIEVTSNLGRGTCFSIRLPRK